MPPSSRNTALDTPFDMMNSAALRAGRLLRARFLSGDAKIYEKSPYDVVTEADLEAESCIKETLINAGGNCGFYTEESGLIHDNSAQQRWVIDPLDGTRNFSRGIPVYATIIALQEKNANGVFETVAGAIGLPEYDTVYYAQRGSGARSFHADGGETILSVERGKSRPDKMIFLGPREAAHAASGDITGEKSFRFRDIGCTGASLTAVAEGKAEGMVALFTNPWDMCAGALMIREAGGIATTFSGNADPEKADHVAAGEPHTYKLIRQYC